MMSKPQPTLSHMPHHIKKSIVESAETISKFSLSQCSKEFNQVVKNSRIIFQKLELHLSERQDYVRISFSVDDAHKLTIIIDDAFIQYRRERRSNVERISTETGAVTFCDAAASQFLKLIEDPKLCVRELEFQFPRPQTEEELYQRNKRAILKKIQTGLRNMRRHIHVNLFNMETKGSEEDFMFILPFLKPGTLDRIEMFHSSYDFGNKDYFVFPRIARTEQWKQTRHLGTENYYMNAPVEEWSHFKTINIRYEILNVPLFKTIYETLIGKEQFTSCHIHYENGSEELVNEMLQQFPCTPPRFSCLRTIIHPTFDVIVIITDSEVRIKKYLKTCIQ